MKVVAIIQARLGSTRLPKKALLNLNGLPLIDHVVKQVEAANRIDSVALSTSDAELDLELVTHFKMKNYSSSTGPVDDIVTRLYRAAQASKADYIARVWGDCPFVCGDILDSMISYVENKNLDFLSNSEINNRSFPPGLDIEIYSKTLLEKMNTAVTIAAQREFPIEYVKANASSVKFGYFHLKDFASTATGIPTGLHLTIDYPEDFKAAEVILKKLSPRNQAFNYRELCSFFENQPELFNLFSKEQRNIEYKNYLNQKEKS